MSSWPGSCKEERRYKPKYSEPWHWMESLLCSFPSRFIPGTHWIIGSIASPGDVEKRVISCPCRKRSPDCSVVKSLYCSRYWLAAHGYCVIILYVMQYKEHVIIFQRDWAKWKQILLKLTYWCMVTKREMSLYSCSQYYANHCFQTKLISSFFEKDSVKGYDCKSGWKQPSFQSVLFVICQTMFAK
jgi:hypothetical protein